MAAEYFKQIEQNVNSLLADEKFREARNLVNQLTVKYPRDSKLIKMKAKVENAIAKSNEKLINKKLKEIKPLWKENKYAEILRELAPLIKIAPRYTKLIAQYSKAQKFYKKNTSNQKKDFLSEQKAHLDQLLEKNSQALINELLDLEMKNPGNRIVRDLSQEYRDKLIAQEIEQHKDLLFSEKFDVINNFIRKLIRIDKKNPRIKQLTDLMKKRQFGTQVNEKSEFVYQGQQHLDTLMKLKKYEKAITVAMEILSVDKNNKQVEKMLKKAKEKNFSQTRETVIDQIEKEKVEAKKKYKQDKDSFTKI